MNVVDVFLNSKELKKTIVYLSKEYEIPLMTICSEIRMDYKYFMNAYINCTDPSVRFEISYFQVNRILEILGIETRVQFVVKRHERIKEVQKILIQRHGAGHWTSKFKQEEGAGDTPQGGDNLFD